jgi:hypothetical protein
MDGVWPYLFRGTSIGWPGNKTLQKVKMTPTSTDPFVATLFALDRFSAPLLGLQDGTGCGRQVGGGRSFLARICAGVLKPS